MNTISKNDMAVVEMQRAARKTGYSLSVSRNEAPYLAKVINPQGCNIICKASSDDRLTAANEAWNKFIEIAKELDIEL